MTIGLEYVFEAFVSVDEDLEIGPVAGGFRSITPITGGTFEGPSIKGTIVPGGADWSIGREDGVMEICARYTLKTDDGVLIYVVNRGIVHEPAEEGIDSEYFRTTPTFEVSSPKYDWLNHLLFVCDLKTVTNDEQQFIGVAIKFYKVT